MRVTVLSKTGVKLQKKLRWNWAWEENLTTQRGTISAHMKGGGPATLPSSIVFLPGQEETERNKIPGEVYQVCRMKAVRISNPGFFRPGKGEVYFLSSVGPLHTRVSGQMRNLKVKKGEKESK